MHVARQINKAEKHGGGGGVRPRVSETALIRLGWCT